MQIDEVLNPEAPLHQSLVALHIYIHGGRIAKFAKAARAFGFRAGSFSVYIWSAMCGGNPVVGLSAQRTSTQLFGTSGLPL